MIKLSGLFLFVLPIAKTLLSFFVVRNSMLVASSKGWMSLFFCRRRIVVDEMKRVSYKDDASTLSDQRGSEREKNVFCKDEKHR